MEKFNVIILSSGLSTRLQPITNLIPKILITINNRTAIYHQIEYWNNYSNIGSIYIVVHSKYVQMTKDYLDMFNINFNNVIIVAEDLSDGSYNTIHRLISNFPELKKNVILNWSDLIPKTTFNNEINFESNIIFTNGNSSRYNVTSDNQLSQVHNNSGNVIGLYYLKNIEDYDNKLDQHDFVDSIIKFKSLEIKDIIDFGDLNKLEIISNNQQPCREFNLVKIKNQSVEKIALNEKGLELQDLELLWYDQAPKKIIPKILNKTNNSFEMEKIEGIELYRCTNLSNIQSLLIELKQFHNKKITISKHNLNSDIKYEAYTKVFDRINLIKPLINSFFNGAEIKTINNINYLNHETIIDRLYNLIIDLNVNKTNYCFIHGDLNFSNIFIDKNQAFKFIDPRGYFGQTKLYGLESYDTAKILYAISGYDKFNSDNLFGNINLNNNNLDINIEPLIDFNFETIQKIGFTKQDFYWLPIIWISLSGYFKNNPLKAITAYYYGLYLGTKILQYDFKK